MNLLRWFVVVLCCSVAAFLLLREEDEPDVADVCGEEELPLCGVEVRSLFEMLPSRRPFEVSDPGIIIASPDRCCILTAHAASLIWPRLSEHAEAMALSLELDVPKRCWMYGNDDNGCRACSSTEDRCPYLLEKHIERLQPGGHEVVVVKPPFAQDDVDMCWERDRYGICLDAPWSYEARMSQSAREERAYAGHWITTIGRD